MDGDAVHSADVRQKPCLPYWPLRRTVASTPMPPRSALPRQFAEDTNKLSMPSPTSKSRRAPYLQRRKPRRSVGEAQREAFEGNLFDFGHCALWSDMEADAAWRE